MRMMIVVPDDLADALKVRAEKDDRSVAATIRVALRQYLDPPPARKWLMNPPTTTFGNLVLGDEEKT
jgi:plasmid stability protein